MKIYLLNEVQLEDEEDKNTPITTLISAHSSPEKAAAAGDAYINTGWADTVVSWEGDRGKLIRLDGSIRYWAWLEIAEMELD